MAKTPLTATVHDERPLRGGGRRIALELHAPGERVPAVLLLPDVRAGAVPAALLLHGYTSRKETMAETVGTALLRAGIASFAPDLPLHGEREMIQAVSLQNPFELMRRWSMAMDEASLALEYLASRPEVDGQPLAIVGYSLGSFLGLVVAAREPRVRAMVVAAGGDLPARTPFAALVRRLADPLRAARRFAGRPLLIVHGRRDRTVLPAQARRLFEAAGEPKELRWWDAGHRLPPEAIAGAAEWLGEQIATQRERKRG